MTAQDIADASGVPLSTVNNFFAHASKSPALYTTAPICAALGVSLDEFFGISDKMTANEETLQAERDGLEHRLENKREAIAMLKKGLKMRDRIILTMSVVLIGLLVWCVWVNIHCANYGFWRG
jgi:transcriptional regulator with XRE-family HTH domain